MLPALLAGAAVLVLLGLPSRRPPGLPPWQAAGRGAGTAPRRQVVVAAVPVALVAIVGLVVVLAGPVVCLLGSLAVVGGRRQWHAVRRARAERVERDGAAEALAVLSAELRAGRPPGLALEAAAEVAAGPVADALRAAGSGSRFGADPVVALLAQTGKSGQPQLLRGLAACWQVCAGTGSSLATSVERLADGLAAEHAQRLAVDAELAGPRATAFLLALLPLTGIALAAGLGARPLHLLLHTPLGLVCLVTGLGLDALGLWWTARLVDSARRAR